MELTDIRALVLSADPQAKRYESSTDGGPYTTWRELRRLAQTSDDEHAQGWAFAVDRFAREQDDPVRAAIEEALDGAEGVAYRYDIDYEPDTGYIHHIYTCEGY